MSGSPSGTRSTTLLALVVLSLIFLCHTAVSAQRAGSQSVAGVIQGEVATQSGTIAIGGADVILMRGQQTEVGRVSSEGDGKFRFENLAPGEYVVTASLEGFQPGTAGVRLGSGQTVTVALDLQLAEVVRVTAADTSSAVPPTGTLATSDAVTSEELQQLAPGGGLQSALRLLASVIEVPGGLAIKGGRPNQASVQIGPGLFVDPATGLTQGSLPDYAIEAVTVLPNPYAVEFGRFSSGLVVIQTRRAADTWKTRVGNLDPAFRTKRGAPFNIDGISSFGPRMEVGGPLVSKRVYLHQSAQYRYSANDIPSRPQDELKTSHRFGYFTRLDATVSDSHSLTVVGGLSPTWSKLATLGTFVPPAATVDIDNDVDTMALTERTIWNDRMFSETTFEVNWFSIQVRPQGSAAMEPLPEETRGNFFNRQDRSAASVQLIHALSGTSHGRFGLHMYKAGFDVVLSRFDAVSDSRPILIRRSDGSLARRLDYGPRTAPSIDSTDLSVFVQDRIQPNSRWYVEIGARLDRDGVIDRLNLTPRVGSALLLNPAGTAVLRGGLGLFFERTPSAVGVFQELEMTTETRYDADGLTPLGPGMPFPHTIAGDLHTPRSRTWDVAYDHRFNPRWAVHAGAIDRRGSREYILDPIVAGSDAALQLRSAGRSSYREMELGVQFTGAAGLDLKASYVRSEARTDLNAFTFFYDSVVTPVLGENEYAPARADVPHRLLARWRAMPTPNWLWVGVLDWRSGLPFSTVNEMLDFVGPRNRARFPTYFRLDLGVEHRVKLFKLRPWIGVRVDNALNSWLPADVQANITSPAFRTFYNSEYRQYRIQFRFDR